MRAWTLGLAFLGFVGLGPRGAGAAPVQYEYGGMITASADPKAAPGTRFSGTFFYDPDTLSHAVEIEGSVGYTWETAQLDSFGSTLQINGQQLFNPGQHSFGVGINEVGFPGSLGHGYYEEGIDPNSPRTSVSIGYKDGNGLESVITLKNPSQSLYQLKLPLSYSLSDFPKAEFVVRKAYERPTSESTFVLYEGKIDTLRPLPIPEPAVATLACFAIAGWAARRRMK